MLHDKFNLFLACGSKQYCEFLLVCNVKNILISFSYSDPWQLKPLLKLNNVNLMCDSGAFTAWNQASKKKREGNPNWKKYLINIDEYAEFVKKHSDIIFRAVNLDVIPGETGVIPTVTQIEEAAEQGWNNYLYLKEKKGINTIHVFHQGEPFKYLDRMLQYCDYIGISPSNDYHDDKKYAWLDVVFRHIMKSTYSSIKTHGFGVTSKKLVERYPWFSVDSSSYSLTAAMGGILTPYGRVYVSDLYQDDPDHLLRQPIQIQKHIEKYLLENIGYGIESMTRNKEDRIFECEKCHNQVIYNVKVPSYKSRNFANIIYFLNLQERVRTNGSTMDFMKQLIFNI